MYRDDLDALLETDRHMVVPASGALASSVVRHLAGVRAAFDPLPQTVNEFLQAAIKALTPLQDEPIDSSVASEARVALERLRTALANCSISSSDDPARALDDAMFDSQRAWGAIARACTEFIGQAQSRSAPATFSIILFRHHDHQGAIQESFDNERERWLDVLAPRALDREDNHLAVVAPSGGATAVGELANAIGVEDQLPCVVFLGRKTPPSPVNARRAERSGPGGRAIWHRLACHRLEQLKNEASYPAALRRIYRTVYGKGAVLGGEYPLALLDRRFSVWLALKLVSAWIAPGIANAVQAAHKTIRT